MRAYFATMRYESAFSCYFAAGYDYTTADGTLNKHALPEILGAP